MVKHLLQILECYTNYKVLAYCKCFKITVVILVVKCNTLTTKILSTGHKLLVDCDSFLFKLISKSQLKFPLALGCD